MISATILILMVLLLLAIMAAVIFIGPAVTRRLNIRLNFYIIGCYIAVILLLSVVCLAIPSSALKPEMSADKVSFYQNQDKTLESNFAAGKFETPKEYTRSDYAFELSSDHVTVTHPSNFPGQVYVGTKAQDTSKNSRRTLEVYVYEAGYITFRGMNFALPQTAPVIELDGSGELSVKPGANRFITVYEFNDQYTIPQFTGADTTHMSWSSSSILAVVVLLPPGVTADGSDYVALPSPAV